MDNITPIKHIKEILSKKITYKQGVTYKPNIKTTVNPKPLLNPLPKVTPLSADMLPKEIGDYIFDASYRIQSPPDFMAIAAVTALAGLLGNKAVIHPKQNDDWKVTPNLWALIIGKSASSKSPSIKEALKPLQKLEQESTKEYKKQLTMHKVEVELQAIEKEKAKIEAKKMLSEDREEAKKILQITEQALAPTRNRLILNDTTVEKLGELFNENSNGLILYRDELSGFLSKISNEDHQSEKAFYLECYDGNGSFVYDRIGRGTIDIKHCTLSIIGGIQPSKISTLIKNTINGTCDDGLIQRFQLAIWPDEKPEFNWIDQAPDKQAKAHYYKVFDKIHAFNKNNSAPKIFNFNTEANKLFSDWVTKIIKEANNDDLHPAIASHFIKLQKTIATLALLFELIINDSNSEEVGVTAVKMALKWSDYLIEHAFRLYSSSINQVLYGARIILKRKDKLKSPFKARKIYRNNWIGLHSQKVITESLELLVDHGYLTENTVHSKEKGGRSTVEYNWTNF